MCLPRSSIRSSRVQGLEGGADAYLAEPIDRGELVATVGALLRLKKAETTSRQQAQAAEKARKELALSNATLEIRVSARTAELRTANESLRELSARLLKMQDDERRRIARDLHDSVGQLLAAICMNMAVIEKETDNLSADAQKAFFENRSFVQQVLQGIRTMSHLLHPPLLDESGLPSALRWYVEEFSQRSGVSVTLEFSPSFERLSSELETAVFRIVQECLGNIHRHSKSPTAEIRIEKNDGSINLAVRDAGQRHPRGEARADQIWYSHRSWLARYEGTRRAAGRTVENRFRYQRHRNRCNPSLYACPCHRRRRLSDRLDHGSDDLGLHPTTHDWDFARFLPIVNFSDESSPRFSA